MPLERANPHRCRAGQPGRFERRTGRSGSSPTAYARIADKVGWQASVYVLLGCSILTWIAIELMARWYEGAQASARVRSAA